MAVEAPAAPSAAPAGISIPRAYVQLFITILIWGGYFVVAKKAVGEASPMALSAARYLLGGALLGVLAAGQGNWPRPTRRELVLLVAMGLTSVFGFNVLSFVGFNHAPASDGSLIMPTIPTLFVLPLAGLLFGERLGRWQAVGLGLLVAGELLVFREALFANDISGERLAGIGIFFVAAFLWALYTVCARMLGTRISPVHATFYSVAIGVAVLAPFSAGPLWDTISGGPSAGLWLGILYLGALQTVVGLVWWFQGVQTIGAGKAAVINTLVPVVALVLAAMFLDDVPSFERVIGAGLVVGGVTVAVSKPASRVVRRG